MREIAPPRAFAWWSTLADALLDLNLRAEAKQAAEQARAHADAGERERATQLRVDGRYRARRRNRWPEVPYREGARR